MVLTVLLSRMYVAVNKVSISINDSTLPSVCYTVIYMVRVGLGLV